MYIVLKESLLIVGFIQILIVFESLEGSKWIIVCIRRELGHD